LLSIWVILGMLQGFASDAGAVEDGADPIIPSAAHEKAVAALKTMGPDRGAKPISSRSVAILGIPSKKIIAGVSDLKTILKDLGAKETPTEFQIELSGDVLFDFDKTDILPDAEAILMKVVGVILASKSPTVIISGHTDAKGSEDYNLKLSKRRADSVKAWLVSKGGIQSEIIQTAGFGKARPIAPNARPDGSDDPQGRQKNRRVEIKISKG